jgi:hypothetical protein
MGTDCYNGKRWFLKPFKNQWEPMVFKASQKPQWEPMVLKAFQKPQWEPMVLTAFQKTVWEAMVFKDFRKQQREPMVTLGTDVFFNLSNTTVGTNGC